MCINAARETYCGYGRGHLDNAGGHVHNEVADYEPPRSIRPDSIGLSGRFLATREYVEAAMEGSALLLSFRGTEVNLVMEATREKALIGLAFEGSPRGADIVGADVDNGGKVTVDEPRMYNLLKADRPLEGHLSITSTDFGFRAYTFTFSGCID